jgi:hypothetical protein
VKKKKSNVNLKQTCIPLKFKRGQPFYSNDSIQRTPFFPLSFFFFPPKSLSFLLVAISKVDLLISRVAMETVVPFPKRVRQADKSEDHLRIDNPELALEWKQDGLQTTSKLMFADHEVDKSRHQDYEDRKQYNRKTHYDLGTSERPMKSTAKDGIFQFSQYSQQVVRVSQINNR